MVLPTLRSPRLQRLADELSPTIPRRNSRAHYAEFVALEELREEREMTMPTDRPAFAPVPSAELAEYSVAAAVLGA